MGAIYTVLAVLVLLLLLPVRLFKKDACVRDHVIRALAPFYRNHLELICAPSVEEAHTFVFKPFTLILVNLASPILGIGVAVAAWIAGAFWGFAIIMGNPDGTERRDDGRDAVIHVRDWWEGYLLTALR